MAPGCQVVLRRVAVLVLPRAGGSGVCSQEQPSVQSIRRGFREVSAGCEEGGKGKGKDERKKGSTVPVPEGVGAATRRGALKPPSRGAGGLEGPPPSEHHVQVNSATTNHEEGRQVK